MQSPSIPLKCSTCAVSVRASCWRWPRQTLTLNGAQSASTSRISGSTSRMSSPHPKPKRGTGWFRCRTAFARRSGNIWKYFYGTEADSRIFPIRKNYLHWEIDRGSKEAGVKRIKIHDLRHSAISLLVDTGFSATAIADRVGNARPGRKFWRNPILFCRMIFSTPCRLPVITTSSVEKTAKANHYLCCSLLQADLELWKSQFHKLFTK